MALESEILGLEIVVEGLRKFASDMEKADSAVGGSASRWGKLGKAAQGAGKILGTVAKVGIAAVATGATLAASAVVGLALGIGKLAIEAAPIEGIKRAFEGLTESFEGGSEAMLKALKESSAGMVTNRDLMTSFNKAATLVSDDFAELLPDSMQYLSKVAAATGEDMGFMMDSLVRGVGRLSPMILDNLGIQVDLVAANEAYALSIGKTVDELDKGEQQMALYEQAMDLLEEKTANMPEVTGTAVATMAELKTMFQDTKDAIGLAFLPALQALLEPLAGLAQDIGPQVVAWAEKAGVWLGENLPVAIENFRAWMAQAWAYIQENVIPVMQRVWAWLAENIPLAIAAAKEAWEKELQPALRMVWKFIKEKVIPIVRKIWTWLKEKIPAAIEKAREFWEDVLHPAIEKVWAFIQDNVIPIFENLVGFVEEDVNPMLEELRRLWEEVIYPALLMVWEFIQDSVLPILQDLADIIEIVLAKAIEYFVEEIWEKKWKPMLEAVWEFIKEKIIPALESFWSWIKEKVGPAIEWLAETVLPVLQKGLDALREILEKVHAWLERVKEILKAIKIPKDFEESSPSAFVESFQNAADILRRMSETELPKLAAAFSVLGGTISPVMGAVSGGGGDTYSTTYNNYLTTTTSMTSGTLEMEFADMAMATR